MMWVETSLCLHTLLCFLFLYVFFFTSFSHTYIAFFSKTDYTSIDCWYHTVPSCSSWIRGGKILTFELVSRLESNIDPFDCFSRKSLWYILCATFKVNYVVSSAVVTDLCHFFFVFSCLKSAYPKLLRADYHGCILTGKITCRHLLQFCCKQLSDL